MKYVIWSIEHQAWWRANSHGYADSLVDAGVYDEAEARDILERANQVAVEECLIPLSAIVVPVKVVQ